MKTARALSSTARGAGGRAAKSSARPRHGFGEALQPVTLIIRLMRAVVVEYERDEENCGGGGSMGNSRDMVELSAHKQSGGILLLPSSSPRPPQCVKATFCQQMQQVWHRKGSRVIVCSFGRIPGDIERGGVGPRKRACCVLLFELVGLNSCQKRWGPGVTARESVACAMSRRIPTAITRAHIGTSYLSPRAARSGRAGGAKHQ